MKLIYVGIWNAFFIEPENLKRNQTMMKYENLIISVKRNGY